jgi:hypothetical protein
LIASPIIEILVYAELGEIAIAHMTENGYVKHRILELRVRRAITV